MRSFNTGWRFGPATAGCDLPEFDDSGFTAVTLPHTVTPLSWQEWDPSAWERVWAYRKHFDAPPGCDGRRVFLDFAAAMTFYDACDELGLMAWEEAPGWGYLGDESWLALAYRDVGEMIVRDRNHPSIIVWGARLNETPNDTAFYASTNELAHALDDSRPTAASLGLVRMLTGAWVRRRRNQGRA